MMKSLKRNFVILEGILGPNNNYMSIHRDELFKHGFNFSKNTDKFRRNGKLIAELGDFQYSFTKDGMVVVRRMNPLIHVIPGFFERWEVDFPYDTAIFDEFVEEFESRFMRWTE